MACRASLEDGSGRKRDRPGGRGASPFDLAYFVKRVPPSPFFSTAIAAGAPARVRRRNSSPAGEVRSLFEGPILDLAYPLFRDAQNLAHLDERPRRLAPETKPEREDELFPGAQGLDQVAHRKMGVVGR